MTMVSRAGGPNSCSGGIADDRSELAALLEGARFRSPVFFRPMPTRLSNARAITPGRRPGIVSRPPRALRLTLRYGDATGSREPHDGMGPHTTGARNA